MYLIAIKYNCLVFDPTLLRTHFTTLHYQMGPNPIIIISINIIITSRTIRLAEYLSLLPAVVPATITTKTKLTVIPISVVTRNGNGIIV